MCTGVRCECTAPFLPTCEDRMAKPSNHQLHQNDYMRVLVVMVNQARKNRPALTTTEIADLCLVHRRRVRDRLETMENAGIVVRKSMPRAGGRETYHWTIAPMDAWSDRAPEYADADALTRPEGA